MTTRTLSLTLLATVAVAAVSMFGNTGPAVAQAPSGWRPLFDGTSVSAWRGYKTDAMPAGWRIEGGALLKDAPVADIMTRDQFSDFELELEWKIGGAGNAASSTAAPKVPDLLRSLSPTARRRESVRQQVETHVRRLGARSTRAELPEASRRGNSRDHRARPTWSIGQRLQLVGTNCGVPTGKVKASKFAVCRTSTRPAGHIAIRAIMPVLGFRNIRIREAVMDGSQDEIRHRPRRGPPARSCCGTCSDAG
jgi:hypothetical protein